ncbi:MAG: glycine cleavage system aminomethyltransferase GcvT [Candidatus Methylacidiphilales bacterium]
MPVQYSSILNEHHAVRQRAGLFDISHMGEVWVSGPGALPYLNRLLTNDAARLSPGQGQYTLMLLESGGVLDDLLLYRTSPETFLLIINASMIQQDLAWMRSHLPADVTLRDASAETAALALQGPASPEILTAAFPALINQPKRNGIVSFDWNGNHLWIARTGYTGEDGFELVLPASAAADLWNHLLNVGQAHGLVPAGLGARDTLRLEACLPLNGHELGPDITPIEAGLNPFLAWNKPEPFLGQSTLQAQREKGPSRRSVAFVVEGPSAPPRAGYTVWRGEEQVGQVTSGSASPTLGGGIGLALVAPNCAAPDTHLHLDIRGRRIPIVIRKKPLYRKRS